MTGSLDLWDLLFAALAMTLVIEGLLPFFSPALWRRTFERALQLTNGQIRFAGLSCMLMGLLLLFLF